MANLRKLTILHSNDLHGDFEEDVKLASLLEPEWGVDIRDDQIFKIGLQQFHFSNTEAFMNLTEEDTRKYQEPKVVSTSARDIVIEYLSSHHKLAYKFKSRLKIIG